MNSSDSFIDYLQDILQAIDKAEKFISGIDFDEFQEDEKTQFAVIRALEIVGEASNKIPKLLQEEHSYIPWKEMSGMRNKLIHDYMGVNEEVVWKTIKEDLPKLKRSILQMQKEI